MKTPTHREAEWTPVTPEPRQGDDRVTVGRELDEVRNGLGLSERALAARLGVDRETLKRFFAGDPSMRPNKWKMIEKRIRELDAEMTSERSEEPAEPSQKQPVEFRFPNIAGGVIVSGSADDMDALKESVDWLIRNYMPVDQGPQD